MTMTLNYYWTGSALIVAALGIHSVQLGRDLILGGGLATADATLLTQLLIFLTLVIGFIFQQIGRYQEAKSAHERAHEDRAAQKQAADLLAETTRLTAENLALQSQLAHKETLDHIGALHTVTVEALDVANHANAKIAATQEAVAEALRALPVKES